MLVNDLYSAPLVLLDGGAGAPADEVALARRLGVPLIVTVATAAEATAIRALAQDAPSVVVASTDDAAACDLFVAAAGTLEALQRSAERFAPRKKAFGLAIRVDANGALEDGTPLADAIAKLDADPAARPWHYIVDAMEPAHIERACEALFRAAPALAHRVVGCRSHLVADFAQSLRACAQRFGLQWLGGLDGTGPDDLAALAR